MKIVTKRSVCSALLAGLPATAAHAETGSMTIDGNAGMYAN